MQGTPTLEERNQQLKDVIASGGNVFSVQHELSEMLSAPIKECPDRIGGVRVKLSEDYDRDSLVMKLRQAAHERVALSRSVRPESGFLKFTRGVGMPEKTAQLILDRYLDIPLPRSYNTFGHAIDLDCIGGEIYVLLKLDFNQNAQNNLRVPLSSLEGINFVSLEEVQLSPLVLPSRYQTGRTISWAAHPSALLHYAVYRGFGRPKNERFMSWSPEAREECAEWYFPHPYANIPNSSLTHMALDPTEGNERLIVLENRPERPWDVWDGKSLMDHVSGVNYHVNIAEFMKSFQRGHDKLAEAFAAAKKEQRFPGYPYGVIEGPAAIIRHMHEAVQVSMALRA